MREFAILLFLLIFAGCGRHQPCPPLSEWEKPTLPPGTVRTPACKLEVPTDYNQRAARAQSSVGKPLAADRLDPHGLSPAEIKRREQDQRKQEEAAADRAEQDRKAEAICKYKGQVAGASYPDPSILGFDSMVAEARVVRACWQLYEHTGIMPSP